MFKGTSGLIPIYLTITITWLIWIISKSFAGDYFSSLWWYISKASALGSVVLMTWSMILSTRLQWVENLFGGLDKTYHLHKKIGKYSLYLILLHPVALAMRSFPDWLRIINFFGFQSWINWYNWGHNIGVFSLILMIILVGVSLWFYLPYHLWKMTHQYFGLVYLLVILHVIFVDADIAAYPVLRLWMYLLMTIGLFSFLYIRFFYYRFGKIHQYKISDIEKVEGIHEITLQPEGKHLTYRPGQFAYLQFINPLVTKELHPYSFAYGPSTHGALKFGVKELGDHTTSLRNLNIGDKVNVYGPYGLFGEKFLIDSRDCVLIGAGIGITPFLSIWDTALRSDEFAVEKVETEQTGDIFQIYDPADIINWKSPIVHLFYVVKDESEASFDNDIKQKAILHQFKGKPNFVQRPHTYELYESAKKGYISINYIESQIGKLTDKNIFICGPEAFTNALIKQLKDIGVPNSQIITENFKLLDEKRGEKIRSLFRKLFLK